MFCGYCYRAKRLLSSKGVDFVEYDITMDGAKRDEMRARGYGSRSAPWRSGARTIATPTARS
jgi:glutaredoxin 3